MREIALIVYALSGEPQITPYETEWPCIQAAERINASGQMAWCLIETPETRGKSEKYPNIGWSKSMPGVSQ